MPTTRGRPFTQQETRVEVNVRRVHHHEPVRCAEIAIHVSVSRVRRVQCDDAVVANVTLCWQPRRIMSEYTLQDKAPVRLNVQKSLVRNFRPAGSVAKGSH